jgi:hypothetical protein
MILYLGWVSWNFLHCHHSRIYQNQRCACEQHSHCVYQCCVCFVNLQKTVLFLCTDGVTPFILSSIEQDLSLPGPPPPPIHGFSDRRRVKELNMVVTDAPVPI